jgi:hypothetical protein
MRSWSRVARWLPVDEQEDGFGWAIDEPLERTSHALRVGGRVWLIDPVDAPELEDRIRALGEPAGVLQLLDRHTRDGAAWSARLGIPLVRAFESVARTPFQSLPVRDNRFWREVALWEPESRTLLCADVLGTLEFFRAGDERIGMHPLLRIAPPRSLLSVAPERVLVGHGGGLHQDAAAAVHETVRTARRRIPAALASAARAVRNSRRSRN